MLLMGDEVRRTQRGNNNAYCHRDDTNWFDWDLVPSHADVRRFAKALIGLRVGRSLPSERFDMTLQEMLRRQPVTWHGVKLNAPDWGHESHTLAATVRLLGDQGQLHLIVNAYSEALEFEIPAPGETHAAWRRTIDTSLDSPDDVCGWADAPDRTRADLRRPAALGGAVDRDAAGSDDPIATVARRRGRRPKE